MKNEVLHSMIGTKHCITSAYDSQSNGHCERQNMKVLDGNPCDWPNIIKGGLFAHWVSKHTSTNVLPFFLMYNREPTLPIYAQI